MLFIVAPVPLAVGTAALGLGIELFAVLLVSPWPVILVASQRRDDRTRSAAAEYAERRNGHFWPYDDRLDLSIVDPRFFLQGDDLSTNLIALDNPSEGPTVLLNRRIQYNGLEFRRLAEGLQTTIVIVPNRELPASVAIERKSAYTELRELVSLPISFESEAFQREFAVKSDDPRLATAVVHPELMLLLLSDGGCVREVKHSRGFTYVVFDPLKAPDLDAARTFAYRVAALLPDEIDVLRSREASTTALRSLIARAVQPLMPTQLEDDHRVQGLGASEPTSSWGRRAMGWIASGLLWLFAILLVLSALFATDDPTAFCTRRIPADGELLAAEAQLLPPSWSCTYSMGGDMMTESDNGAATSIIVLLAAAEGARRTRRAGGRPTAGARASGARGRVAQLERARPWCVDCSPRLRPPGTASLNAGM